LSQKRIEREALLAEKKQAQGREAPPQSRLQRPSAARICCYIFIVGILKSPTHYSVAT
jgi:hypothetical protein